MGGERIRKSRHIKQAMLTEQSDCTDCAELRHAPNIVSSRVAKAIMQGIGKAHRHPRASSLRNSPSARPRYPEPVTP